MDVLTSAQRHRNMASIHSKDTKPELKVRKLIRSWGYRYRLHVSDILGKPDIVFPRFRKVIFVHGCFWHMHKCRYGMVIPKTRKQFWQKKRKGNVERDKKVRKALKKDGWKVLVIWECWTKNPKILNDKLMSFFNDK